MNQAELDRANADFWGKEICGTSLARLLGHPSLEEFDAAYLNLYPWLRQMASSLVPNIGTRVLEIGPGYGTFGRLLIAAGADYTTLDIAPGVIEHTREHTTMKAHVGNVLELDAHFKAKSFDAAAAIGCLHHTGNLPRAIEQLYRVLRPGGTLLAMVYGDGNVCDFHTDGTPAPHTDVTPPDRIPELFAAFSVIDIDLRGPHDHTDVYVRATK